MQLAADRQLGAFVHADAQIGEILVELVLVDDRPDMRSRLQGIVDDEALHPLGHRLGELRIDPLR